MNGKRTLALVTALLLALSLAACSGGEGAAADQPIASEPTSVTVDNTAQPSEEPAATPEAPQDTDDAAQPAAPAEVPAGFTTYEDAANGVRLAYPEGWLEVSAQSMQIPEMQEMMAELLQLDTESAAAALEQIQLYLYDIDNMSEAFAPNMNMVVGDSGGMSQGMLQNPLLAVQLKQQVEAQYAGTFENLVWLQDPEPKTLGGVTYLTSMMSYTAYGVDIGMYQAMAVNGDSLYTFTFSTMKDLLESNQSVYEQVLSTVELG